MRNLAPGDVFEGHTLVRKIGEGGYGEVWQADYYGTSVALKLFTKGGRVSHIRNEAIAQYKLGRLHGEDARFFPRVEHIQVDGEIPYMRMELIEGMPLEQFVRTKSGLELGERLDLAAAVLEALAVVHRSQLVHGDLSPANVIVTDDRGIKLIDVGFGAVFGGDQVRSSVSDEAPLGVAAPMYASPERFRMSFRDCGKPADVYSFGKLLYFVLTGEEPLAIKPLSKRFAELDSTWDEFIYRCIENDPARRFEDAAQAREAMVRLRETPTGFIAECLTCRAATLIPEQWLGQEFVCRSCGARMEVLYFDVEAGRAEVRLSDETFTVSAPAEAPAVSTCPGCGNPVPRGRSRCGSCSTRRRTVLRDLATRPQPTPGPIPDYTDRAVLAFLLLFLFWLPGAVATTVFLAQAKEVARVTGVRPSGMDVLEGMMWIFVYVPVALIALVLLLVIGR
jgi:serine/threonine protein kinase